MQHSAATNDDDLMARAAAGDGLAFGQLVERHAPGVLRLARAVTGDAAEADDVVQEAFISAFRSASTYRPGLSNVRTWLFAIARNAARRRHRGNRERPLDELHEAPLLQLGVAAGWGAAGPAESFDRAEQVELLAHAVSSLPFEDREVLVLRDLEGLSGDEAAEILGIGLHAMKSRLHRARLRLLAAVRASEGGVPANEQLVGGIPCSGVLTLLGDYVDGELGEQDLARVQAHLVGCTICERFGGRYARVVRSARERLGAAPSIDDAQLDRIRALLR